MYDELSQTGVLTPGGARFHLKAGVTSMFSTKCLNTYNTSAKTNAPVESILRPKEPRNIVDIFGGEVRFL